jgi:hypothetical protein
MILITVGIRICCIFVTTSKTQTKIKNACVHHATTPESLSTSRLDIQKAVHQHATNAYLIYKITVLIGAPNTTVYRKKLKIVL